MQKSTVVPNPYQGGRTKKAPAAQTDINFIIRRFLKTGMLPSRSEQPFYGDVTNVGDFQTLQNRLVFGKALFNTLSDGDKAKFKNSPAEFLDWALQPKKPKAVVPPKVDPPKEEEKAPKGKEV